MRRHTRPPTPAAAMITALLLAGTALAGWAQAQTPQATIDGTLVAVNGNSLTLTVPDGSVKTATVRDDTLILARQAAKLDSIKTGDALGVAARRGSDGSLIANSINIFAPEVWGRARKGQFPMQSGDIMTNAVVTQAENRVDGRVLYLQLEDRVAEITVPESAQIHRMIKQKAADLKPGMRVVVRGTAGTDGMLAASSVNFELSAM